ncbi:MAG: isochorismate synthase, partial [Solirubrobacterales bacterium]|nr:isochorismate synthase [Solirubrobacterales bacterium]
MLDTTGILGSLEGLLARAEGGSRRLVSVTAETELADPAAAAFASRLAGDRWFTWEQPDRDGFALAGLGAAHEAVSRGDGRFADLTSECAVIARGRIADEPDGLPAGAGPVWTGGFAFAGDGASAAHWSSFPPALLVLPELSLLRVSGRCWLTLSAVAGAGVEAAEARERLGARLASLRERELPLLDPHPRGATSIVSVTPPGRYEASVAAATARIAAGELEKVALAREVAVQAPAAHDPAATFGALRSAFESCFCFCVGSPEGAFLGASPELLIRRRGAGAATVALAGSTRRSADPAVDDHLGEQLLRSAKNRSEHEIVARRIERALAPRSVWVEIESEPSLVKVANIQHLATPVHAQL